MPSNLNTPEQIALTKQKREHERLKKQKQRLRYAEQDALDELIKLDKVEPGAAQQAIWARNKAKLTTEEIATLEARQAEFIGLMMDVEKVIADLPNGRKIDPANGGLPFIDTLWQECQPFVSANDGTRLVFHMSPEEFADLHRDIAGRVYKHFTENIDAEWFLYGYYTRFTTVQWNEFVNVAARYFIANPQDENLEKDLCDKILAEYQKRQPRHIPEMTHNLFEADQRAEYDRVAALQLEKEITDAQKNRNQFPPSFEF